MASDRVELLRGQLESGMVALVGSEEWLAWLKVAVRFHHYSAYNQLLIALQCGAMGIDPTYVAGYKAWQGMGRQVRKGEKSLGILAPSTRKVRDEATGEDDKRLVGFHVVSVFDVSQTDGEPLPAEPRPVLLEGDAPSGLWNALEGIATANGYTVTREDCGSANGVTIPGDRAIKVRPDVSDAQACKTLCHECAHVALHTDGDDLTISHRGVAEVEAESVAYIVANYFGIPTESYSLPYVAGWSDGKVEVIKATAQRVTKTAQTMIDAIEKSLAA